MNITLSYRVLS